MFGRFVHRKHSILQRDRVHRLQKCYAKLFTLHSKFPVVYVTTISLYKARHTVLHWSWSNPSMKPNATKVIKLNQKTKCNERHWNNCRVQILSSSLEGFWTSLLKHNGSYVNGKHRNWFYISGLWTPKWPNLTCFGDYEHWRYLPVFVVSNPITKIVKNYRK